MPLGCKEKKTGTYVNAIKVAVNRTGRLRESASVSDSKVKQ